MVCLNIFAALAILGVALPSSLATQWIVGDTQGWGLSVDYTTWASGKTFLVGDTLVFNYNQGSHDVVSVTGTEYQKCTESNGAVPLTSGHDVITLAVAGNHWYICDFPEHCSSGMKLVVDVLSGTPAISPPKSPPKSPTESPPPQPPSSSGALAPQPPPPSSSGALAPPPPPTSSSGAPPPAPLSSSSAPPPPPPPPSAATGIAFSNYHAWIVGVFSILMIIMV